MNRKLSKIYIPIILVFLSILDLKTELTILFDHLTITSLIYTIKHHLLAITVIILSPSLFKAYANSKKLV